MKIVDGFTFYNETKILKYRLNLLKEIVDQFILVEATHTHTGMPKKLFFDTELLNSYNIIHIIVDDLPYINNPNKDEVWENERFQRNCISRGLDKIQLDPSDYLIISDVDEIPDPKTLQKIKTNNTLNIGMLFQDLYYFNINCRLDQGWDRAKILRYFVFCSMKLNCNSIRIINDCEKIPKGGWHLSYFGNPEHISNKIKNFSHQEFNLPCYTDINKITQRIQNKQDIFDRHHMQMLPANIDYLPPNLTDDLFKD